MEVETSDIVEWESISFYGLNSVNFYFSVAKYTLLVSCIDRILLQD